MVRAITALLNNRKRWGDRMESYGTPLLISLGKVPRGNYAHHATKIRIKFVRALFGKLKIYGTISNAFDMSAGREMVPPKFRRECCQDSPKSQKIATVLAFAESMMLLATRLLVDKCLMIDSTASEMQ